MQTPDYEQGWHDAIAHLQSQVSLQTLQNAPKAKKRKPPGKGGGYLKSIVKYAEGTKVQEWWYQYWVKKNGTFVKGTKYVPRNKESHIAKMLIDDPHPSEVLKALGKKL